MSDWRDAIRRELHRYQQATGNTQVTLDALRSQCEDRFYQIAPANSSPDARLRQTLQQLRTGDGTGEIDFVDSNGTYTIERLQLEELETPVLTELQRALLEQWGSVVEEMDRGEEFDLTYYDATRARELATAFIKNPSRARFIQLWELLYSAHMQAQPTVVYEKFEQSDEELAALIDEILTEPEYNSGWEEQLGAKHSLWELYGLLHLEEEPIINGSTIAGLELFGYTTPSTYREWRAAFEDFRDYDYQPVVGHRSNAELNAEIDQLCNVIDKVDRSSIHAETELVATELYRLVLQCRQAVTIGWRQVDNLLEFSTGTSFWQISPGEVEFDLWQTFTDHSIIAIGWGELGDLSTLSETEHQRAHGEDRTTKNVASTYEFGHKIQSGDVIIAKKGRSRECYGIGVVTSEYYHDPAQARRLHPEHPTYSQFLNVKWVIDFPSTRGERLGIDSLRKEFVQWTVNCLPKRSIEKADYRTIITAIIAEGATADATRQAEQIRTLATDHRQQPSGTAVLDELYAQLKDHAVYWVTQKQAAEFEYDGPHPTADAYLQATLGKPAAADVEKVREGDVVFNYHDKHVIGYSVACTDAKQAIHDGETKVRVPLELRRFADPIPLDHWRQALVLPENQDVGGPLWINPRDGYLFELPPNLARTYADICAEYLGYQAERSPRQAAERLSEYLSLNRIELTAPSELYFEDDYLIKQVTAALNAGKNIIFTGPPGTGKSKLAKDVCGQAPSTVEDTIFTTATAEWTAYDTVGGYMPSSDDGGESLEFNAGQFLRCFRTDEGGLTNRWLIIDELNRADIDKAFGQLFSVLSGDSVELPYSRDEPIQIEWIEEDADRSQAELEAMATNQDRYLVTPSWRLIGTMNTVDKTSLYEMSYAFMRRFDFIHVGIPELRSTSGEDAPVRTELLDPGALETDAENYITAWFGDLEDPTEESQYLVFKHLHRQLSVLWCNINEGQQIGPAIIEDIAAEIAAYEFDRAVLAAAGSTDDPTDTAVERAISDAVVSLVFPQLEGMRPDKQKQLIRGLSSSKPVETDGEVEQVAPQLLGSHLERKAEDIFAIDFTANE